MEKRGLYAIIVVLVITIGYLAYVLDAEKKIIRQHVNELTELQGMMADQSYKLENITIISKLQHYAEGSTLDN